MRCSLAAMASSVVGDRRGRARMSMTGSLSDKGVVGVLNVSPFLSCIVEEADGASVPRAGRLGFEAGRRRGCTRAGSSWEAVMMDAHCMEFVLAHKPPDSGGQVDEYDSLEAMTHKLVQLKPD